MINDPIIQAGRARFDLFDRGDILPPLFLGPCRLKILVVVDGYPGGFLNVSFSNSYFGLSVLMDTFRENPEWWAKFDITRAHRQTDTFKPHPIREAALHDRYGPHYENFRFAGPGKPAGFNLDDYDQVWLFGARADENESQRLDDAELEVLARWMDTRKGGLFATGDHADLGASLCSRVPRGGTMRRWTQADGVPSPGGPDRHDTLLKGHDSFYTFNDESDDVPMHTTVRRYPLSSWIPGALISMPHPVLCGVDGVIDILPDHPHEGWVNEDADVTLTNMINVGNYNAPEYPALSGLQPTPEVIAWAHVKSNHTDQSDLNKGAANGKRFGAIGAYNGHVAEVGRVVVDSTWHHWFDVNLTGRPTAPGDDPIDPVMGTHPKAKGFEHSSAGLGALARIKNYFRNVALWLAPPSQQRCMFVRAAWGAVHRYHLAETLDPSMSLWELGRFAKDVIGRRAGQCTMLTWIYPLFPKEIFEELRPIFEVPHPRPDPCLTCPPFEAIELMVLGGISREMMKLSYQQRAGKGKITEQAVASSLVEGLSTGIRELDGQFKSSVKRSQRMSKTITSLAESEFDAKDFMQETRKMKRGKQSRKK